MDYMIKKYEFTEAQCVKLEAGKCYGLLITMQGSGYLHSSLGNWRLGSEELMVCKPGTISKLEYAGGKYPLKIMWMLFSPMLMDRISTEKTHVRVGFETNPNPVAVIRPGSKPLMLIKNLTAQMEAFPEEPNPYCFDLLEESTVKMFAALVLRSCASEDKHAIATHNAFSLDGVFSYIHAHLTEELTLDRLEKEFFVSSSYLNKEFKRRTGQTVHRYIVKVRLDLCRRYLEQGYSVSQIYRMAGFGGYNHFFKAFKKEYGITPKEYRKSLEKQLPPTE